MKISGLVYAYTSLSGRSDNWDLLHDQQEKAVALAAQLMSRLGARTPDGFHAMGFRTVKSP